MIDAVGMEAHGSPGAKLAQQVTGLLPDAVAETLMQKAGIDRLHAFYLAIDIVRRGGTISLIGVYGGMADPLPMLTMFDKQIQLRMGQANVKRWVDDILPLLMDGDPLGVDGFARTACRSTEAPEAYEKFQKKEDGGLPARRGGRAPAAQRHRRGRHLRRDLEQRAPRRGRLPRLEQDRRGERLPRGGGLREFFRREGAVDYWDREG